jgi:hypothetical protein
MGIERGFDIQVVFASECAPQDVLPSLSICAPMSVTLG